MNNIWWFSSLLACSETKTDTGSIQPWSAAPLSEISGTCPTIDNSRELKTFTSNGTERSVQFVLPTDSTADIQPVFFFHGLMPEGSNPTNQLITGLSLQSVADEYNIAFILPVSEIWELFGQRFHLWKIEQGTEDNDLVVFDDLRTCLAEHFDVYNSDALNMDSLSTLGFSGGALFNTVILSNRSDTLASAVEISGGADLTIPGFSNPFSVHNPASINIPVLLVSGGSSDVWPDATLPVVDFESATGHLFSELQQAGQTSVHCRHNNGHTITPRAWTQTLDWLTDHSVGVDSPYASPQDSWSDWCVWEE